MIGGNVTDLEKWHRDIMLEAMAEGIERERAAQEKRRKEEEDRWDPLGVNRKKLREAEERWCEAETRWREEKRKRMFPTPWEKDL